MPAKVRYVPNNRSFGALMRSDQTQDLADQGARAGVLAARALAASLGLPARYAESIKAVAGPLKVLGRNARRTAQVEADYAYFEFGSGQKRNRPQGGRSPAYRVLGRTASVIGTLPRKQG